MNDKFYNNLKDDLKPYYGKGDCCSWIVELRKENNQLQSNWNSLREYYKRKAEETKDSTALYDKWTKYSSVLDKMNELEKGDNK